MKVFAVLLLLNCLSLAYSQNIVGEWWSYNSQTQGHDYLIIDEDLNFILEITNPEKKEFFEGRLRLISSTSSIDRYIAEMIYNDAVFGEIYYYSVRSGSLDFRLYTNDLFYDGFFYRDMRYPSPTPSNPQTNFGFFDFDFLPTPGMFGWQFGFFDNTANQNYFTIDIYSLSFAHLFTNSYMTIIPAKYFYNINNSSHEMSFMNLEIHWDALSLGNRNRAKTQDNFFTLGPHVSFNWLHLMDFNSFDYDRYDFRAGLKFIFLLNLVINLESGYINSNGNHGFYFSVVLGNALPIVPPLLFLMEL